MRAPLLAREAVQQAQTLWLFMNIEKSRGLLELSGPDSGRGNEISCFTAEQKISPAHISVRGLLLLKVKQRG